MAIRIKSRWVDQNRERSLPEIATALAYITWRIALDRAIQLHCERFVYRDDAQRFAVISEYLVFLIQVADRLAHEDLDDDDRRVLITEFAKNLIVHIQDNGQDILGPADYGTPFIALLNERSDEYAEFKFGDDGPSYLFLRHLGLSVQALVGQDHENRWVIDQVMEKDGPEIYKSFRRAFGDLFD